MTDTVADIEGQRTLRDRVGAVRMRRDVVRASGADARSFLQGQLSQDVEGLPVGGWAWSLVLEPGGRVDAWMRVWATGEDELLLEVDAGAGPKLLERLNRFRIRVQVDTELLDWQMVAVRGPSGPGHDALAGAADLVAPVDWAGLPGVDLVGPGVEVPAGVPEVTPEALDAVRIEAGWPAMGTELGPDLDPMVIPAEAGAWLVDASVSFTKGCYTGQELVARVDSRGSNTPRRLHGIVAVDAAVAPPAGAQLVVDDQVRGTVTSSGVSDRLGAAVALSYVHRSVEPGTRGVLRWSSADGPAEVGVEVRDLPLVGERR